eukprot:CAMPEP_0196655910 /NCGR_PEP_ID=MMETSP1086-20130531/10950_1 /TAXON_ID=77921 /ORGANISM="Cyanoptyche  gloeocystis , Strain SAG4.97" /LENGTH=288 /DNA_ID=CAMNT_0041988449 /DNA_START=153 /DNA_END=1019 /DNA_ORIENTATION=-
MSSGPDVRFRIIKAEKSFCEVNQGLNRLIDRKQVRRGLSSQGHLPSRSFVPFRGTKCPRFQSANHTLQWICTPAERNLFTVISQDDSVADAASPPTAVDPMQPPAELLRYGNQTGSIRTQFTWEEIEQHAREVARKLREYCGGKPPRRVFDVVLAITRGGLVPGCLLSEALELRQLLTASVMFYTGQAAGLTLEAPAFLQFPNDNLFQGKHVLLVDDVWDSGCTATAVRSRLQRAGASKVTVAVLHYKPAENKFPPECPDFYAVETDAWIVYPWEPEALQWTEHGEDL